MKRSSLVNEVRQLRALAAYRVQEAREVQDESRVLRAALCALRSDMQEVRSINAERNWRLRQEVRCAVQYAEHAEEVCLCVRSSLGPFDRWMPKTPPRAGRRPCAHTYLGHERQGDAFRGQPKDCLRRTATLVIAHRRIPRTP
jgi:hypothetical protein